MRVVFVLLGLAVALFALGLRAPTPRPAPHATVAVDTQHDGDDGEHGLDAPVAVDDDDGDDDVSPDAPGVPAIEPPLHETPSTAAHAVGLAPALGHTRGIELPPRA